MTELTQKRLKELLDYDPNTGLFYWNVSRGGKATIGSVAGKCHPSGYIVIGVDGRRYQAHRLCFLFMTGKFPPDQVDHIDGDKSNNKWNNLRPCSKSENMQNRGATKTNTCGRKGVRKLRKKYQANITVNGQQQHLGTYGSVDEAGEAYDKVAEKLHGAFFYKCQECLPLIRRQPVSK